MNLPRGKALLTGSGSSTTPSFPTCSDKICVSSCEPLIKAEHMTIRYGNKVVLEDVSLSVAPCSITAVIGPSGCGKSSLLAAFNRLTDLTPACRVSGSLRIGPLDVLAATTNLQELRCRVGMVFQRPNPFPLSIWQNLALPLQQHGVTQRGQVSDIIEAALTDVGLWVEVKDRLQSSALALSGGQQQRLCIARTLALKPEVVLFDEPCSALDPIAAQTVETLIAGLRRRYTVVIVTHNLAQARRISDSLAVFWMVNEVGRLIEQGPTERIFAAPSHPQTKAYITGEAG